MTPAEVAGLRRLLGCDGGLRERVEEVLPLFTEIDIDEHPLCSVCGERDGKHVATCAVLALRAALAVWP